MKKTERYKRNLKEAQKGFLFLEDILDEYEMKIREQKIRQQATKNRFIWTCCQQEIDQLTAEMNSIEAEA